MKQTGLLLLILLTLVAWFPAFTAAKPIHILIVPFQNSTDVPGYQTFGDDLAALLELQLHFYSDSYSIHRFSDWKKKMIESKLYSQEELNKVSVPSNQTHPLIDLEKPAVKKAICESPLEWILMGTSSIQKDRIVVYSKLVHIIGNKISKDIQYKDTKTFVSKTDTTKEDSFDGSYFAIRDALTQINQFFLPVPNSSADPQHDFIQILWAIDTTPGMEIVLDHIKPMMDSWITSFSGLYPSLDYQMGALTFSEPTSSPTWRFENFTSTYSKITDFIQTASIKQGIHNRVNINALLEKITQETTWSPLANAQRLIILFTDSIDPQTMLSDAMVSKLQRLGIRLHIIQSAAIDPYSQKQWQQQAVVTGGSFSVLTYRVQSRINDESVRVYYHGENNGTIFLEYANAYSLDWDSADAINDKAIISNGHAIPSFQAVYGFLTEKGLKLKQHEQDFVANVEMNISYLLNQIIQASYQPRTTSTLIPLEVTDASHYSLKVHVPEPVLKEIDRLQSILPIPLVKQKNQAAIAAIPAIPAQETSVYLMGKVVATPTSTEYPIGFTFDPKTIRVLPLDFLNLWFDNPQLIARIQTYLFRNLETIQTNAQAYADYGLFLPNQWIVKITIPTKAAQPIE